MAAKINTEKKFSIIIPTWNNLDLLQLCIDSIRKNSTFLHQIIVHVNEGTDGTIAWVKNEKDISFSFSEKNIGVCFALNECRKLVETDYILYINDDMYVCPKWDEVLFNEIQKIGHNKFFLSSTAIEPKAQSICSIEKDFGTSIKNFNEEQLLNQFSGLKKADWQGATWPPNIVHKDIWDAVGGYSIEFSPGMYSDPDFSMKLWKYGVRYFKGLCTSRVYHFGSASVKRIKKNNGYYMFISKWKMTSSTFTKYFLQRGQIFHGELKEPQLPFFIEIKNFWKRFMAVFH